MRKGVGSERAPTSLSSLESLFAANVRDTFINDDLSDGQNYKFGVQSTRLRYPKVSPTISNLMACVELGIIHITSEIDTDSTSKNYWSLND